ncbi:hypothetical protein [Novipirellula maiorica]
MTATMLCFLCCANANAQRDSFEGPPINYLTAPANDPVTQLAAKVEAGEVKLRYDLQHGYLKSVLEALDVPISSQTLVFSKTSLQLRRISTQRPRALYFNDDVYVGWCQRGDVIEFAATDAKQGAMFYTLGQTQDGSPKFVRDRGQCLTCHASSRTQNVPGYLVRSVFADSGGQPIFGSGTFNTDQTSPFDQRWGGWYVTGTHGEMRHMGNITYEEGDTDGDREAGANRESLEGIVSTTPYLSRHSDLVALMVLEHQTQMHNAIAAANYETREAVHQSYQMNEFLERAPDYLSDSAQRRIAAAADRVVHHMLMCDEFALTSPVAGTSRFAEEFAARGIRDAEMRSLRDLDLNTRLFRYPCSYLIYSDAFDGLPEQVRNKIIDRLTAILENRADAPEFAHLTPTMRSEILAILRQTKPEFADNKETNSL